MENSISQKGLLLKGIRGIAEHYQCGTNTIQKLVNSGKIKTYRLGKNRFAYSNEVDEALLDESYKNKNDVA
jgi:hypothetical protein